MIAHRYYGQVYEWILRSIQFYSSKSAITKIVTLVSNQYVNLSLKSKHKVHISSFAFSNLCKGKIYEEKVRQASDGADYNHKQ